MHIIELKRINGVDIFFNNIKYVRDLGCSFLVQVNLCDEYIPYLWGVERSGFSIVRAKTAEVVCL